jgi:DNA-binding beta-propeller fold protein YncE
MKTFLAGRAVTALFAVACGAAPAGLPPAPTARATTSVLASAPAQLAARSLPLPGASGNAFLDHIAYERGARRVWVPVGSTGSVDVLDTTAGSFTRIDGFRTVQRAARGQMRTMGPSAVSIGDGVAYVGNQGSSEVCAIDVKTLKLQECLQLRVPIDGVVYVAATKEVWVTSPHDGLLVVLDASKPAQPEPKIIIPLAGEPEGYAVDESRGVFYTNLEDQGGTVVIDVKTHHPRATWSAGCNADGPRGVAVDETRNLLVVACTDHLQVLDAGHDGARLGTLDTGAGVDNIELLAAKKLVYVAAGKAARLTIARLDGRGQLEVIATAATSPGARNPVADEAGNAYVADSPASRILAFDVRALGL